MNILLVGLNHKTAPVEVREKLAIPESRLQDAFSALMSQPGVEEGMIISTCNRVEVLACSRNGTDLRGFLSSYAKLDPMVLNQHLYEYQDKEAVRHLFRVASSLDSLVVGESQILGQVKEAYATARGLGAVQSHLDALVSRSFAIAKRVRTETAIGSSAVSIASVAVDLAKKIFGSLQGRTVYVVGAGKMSELAARHLLAQGAGTIFVANRTHERAEKLAAKFNGRAIRYEELYDTVDKADIVISSTGAPHYIFRREHGEMFLNRRRNKPMFFIDIAVPRDVDPEMNKLDGLFVYDIDDLQQVVSSNTADRRREAEKAEAIVESEVERFQQKLQSLEVVPMIVSLQEQLELIRQAEIDRVRGRLGSLSPEQEQAIEAMTRGIVNKILHTPITTLKTAARDPEQTPVVDAVRRLFNLQSRNTEAAESRARKS